MKKRIVCWLIVLSLMSHAIVPFAGELRSEKILVEKVENVDGGVFYFLRTDEKTINAIYFENGTIDFSLAYVGEKTVEHAELSLVELRLTSDDMTDITTWRDVCKEAVHYSETIQAAKDVTFIKADEMNYQNRSGDMNFIEFFLDELEALYGSDYSNRLIGRKLFDGTKYAYVYEHYDPYATYIGKEVSLAGVTLQVFATLLGVEYSLLGILLGLTLGQIVPMNTEVALYHCVAAYERVGKVSNRAYYFGYHDLIHLGLANLETGDVVFDEDVRHDLYDPSEEGFQYEEFVDSTIESYRSSN